MTNPFHRNAFCLRLRFAAKVFVAIFRARFQQNVTVRLGNAASQMQNCVALQKDWKPYPALKMTVFRAI